MIRMLVICLGLMASVVISGCADHALLASRADLQPVPTAKTLTATGYGTVSRDQQFRLTPAQRRLMAMRAAKMDALRALAEQVYGISIHADTAVEEMTVKKDNYQGVVESILQGARVVRSTAVDQETYQIDMELRLAPVFGQCRAGFGRCQYEIQLTETAAGSQLVAENSVDKLAGRCEQDECYNYQKVQGFNDRYTISHY